VKAKTVLKARKYFLKYDFSKKVKPRKADAQIRKKVDASKTTNCQSACLWSGKGLSEDDFL